jgi:DNA topoisomerase-1
VKLLIVESPNKRAKIQKYLGPGYEVAATSGHFRDLPERDLGIDVASMTPSYEVHEDKTGMVSKLRAQARSAEQVLLATDPDREGEAISFHLHEVLGVAGALRVTFDEITEKAVKAAVAAPRKLNRPRVDAQQARRLLDRLVGYQVSPLLKVFGPQHSAGRVQSAVLHLVVAREKEREAFKQQTYWTLTARYGEGFSAKVADVNDKGELVERRIATEVEARALAKAAEGAHIVQGLKTVPVIRKPKPPFTTASLQRAASVQLNLKPDRTMELAQKLFEAGHISYHRTDSVTVSDDAIQVARAHLAKTYPEALPPEPVRYTNKGAAQAAHEAIRPTSLEVDVPEGVAGEGLDLYRLIVARFLASQCKPAQLEQTTVSIASGTTTWRARGTVVRFPSFLKFLSGDEDDEAKEGEEQSRLPALSPSQVLTLAGIDVKKQLTQPPPRYTQASLIQAMERLEIGRPSTYAPSVGVLFERRYIEEEKKKLAPTTRGRTIDHALELAFPDLVRADYTAKMEKNLDAIEAGQLSWKPELLRWYRDFSAQVQRAGKTFAAEIARSPALAEEAPKPTGKQCPLCKSDLVLRQGAKGAFLACTGYPKCSYSADPSAKASDLPCPKCKGPTEEREGQFGRFARCLAPACKATIDLSPAVAGIQCPTCAGPMRDRGEFYSCKRYPDCKGSLPKLDPKALAKAVKAGKVCPECSKPLQKRKGQYGEFWGCTGYPSCRFIEKTAKRAVKAS